MFTNIVATSQYVWAPSQGLNSDEDGVCERRTNAVNEDPHLEKGSGDSEEDSLPNFVDDVNNMVVGKGAQLFSHLDKLVGSVSTKSECTSSSLDKKMM